MSNALNDATFEQIQLLLHQQQGMSFRADEVARAVACEVTEAQRILELLAYRGTIERQQSINGPVTYVAPKYAR